MSGDFHNLHTEVAIARAKQADVTDTYAQIVEDLAVSAVKHIQLHMKALFASSENIIVALPESCGFSEDVCSEAHRLLQSSQSTISNHYMLLINDRLKPAALPDVSAQEPDDSSELIDKDEVEAMVAITEIHSNAINVFGDSVQQLEARLEYLEITTDASFDKHSVSPKQLCESFYEALVESGMGSSHIVVLLTLYDKTINCRLSELYDVLNTILIEADVLPNIILGTHGEGGEGQNGVQARIVSYYNPLENKAEHYIERSENESNFFALQCMNGDMTVSGDAINLPESFKKAPSYDEIEGKDCYARKDVVVALSKLQQALITDDKSGVDITSDDDAADIGVIKSSLFNSMQDGQGSGDTANGKHVNLLDERSIDFVGMMFDVIADDDNIPSLIKAQIMRLQISVIKVSITDKTLFENPQHPVRGVLNLITEVGQGIVGEEDDAYKQVSTVISKLLKEYYMDISSFKRAEKELKALLSRREASIKKREQEEQRKIIKEHARNVVLTELKCLSAKKSIPKVVQPLVLKYLPTIMINQYVLYGRESTEWVASTSLLKQLIQCLQPLKKNDEWLYLKENESTLLKDLNTTLCKTSQEKQTIQALLGSLKALFHDMLFNFGFKNVEDTSNAENLADIVDDMEILDTTILGINKIPEPDASDTIGEPVFSDAEKVLQDALTIAQTKIRNLPEQVHPGVWFEIYNGEEHAVRRLKLSVILNDTAKVVFSDRRGNTVMEKDAGDFSEELASNKSKMIADHSTFENALGSVIASLVA